MTQVNDTIETSASDTLHRTALNTWCNRYEVSERRAVTAGDNLSHDKYLLPESRVMAQFSFRI